MIERTSEMKVRTEKYSVDSILRYKSLDNTKFVAVNMKSIAWVSIIFPISIILLFLFATSSKGLGFLSFFYLFRQEDISPLRPAVGVVALTVWIWFFSRRAVSIVLRSGCAVDIDKDAVFFFGNKIPLDNVSHFERRVRGWFSTLALVLLDGSEIEYSESYVRGFPLTSR